MSDTVADAAETASTAPRSAPGALTVCCEPPLGSSTRTTLTQNAIRRRKNIDPALSHSTQSPHPRFVSCFPDRAAYARRLKARFARPHHFYENLKERHLS